MNANQIWNCDRALTDGRSGDSTLLVSTCCGNENLHRKRTTRRWTWLIWRWLDKQCEKRERCDFPHGSQICRYHARARSEIRARNQGEAKASNAEIRKRGRPLILFALPSIDVWRKRVFLEKYDFKNKPLRLAGDPDLKTETDVKPFWSPLNTCSKPLLA